MKEVPKNCRECGAELQIGKVNASEIDVHHMDSQGGSMFRLDNPFNEKTGERNVATTHTCPSWKTKWFLSSNYHDKIVFYEDDLHWL